MPITITSNLKTSQPYIPLVDDGDQVKIGGVPLLFDSAADLKAKCTLQRTNIENGLGLWKNGTPLRVVTEPVARNWIRGTGGNDAANAAASSAKTFTLPFGTVITLLDEDNTFTSVTAIPAAGDGANGDQAWNRSTGVIYTKTAGAWTQSGVDGAGNSVKRAGLVGDVAMPSTPTGAAKGGLTWQQTIMLPAGIDAVSIALLSDVADVSTYTGIKVSVQTTDAANLINPIGAAALIPVTFAGAANPTFVAGTAADPVPVWSDVMPVPYRTAGPSWLIVRVWYPGTVAAGGGFASLSAAQIGGAGSRPAKVLALGGAAFYGNANSDLTANPAAGFSVGGATLPLIVQSYYRTPVPVLWQFGDSTRQGWNGDGCVSAAQRWALARTLAGKPVSMLNQGYSGQTSAQYFARLRRLVAAGKRCDALVYQIASPNDGFVAGISDAQIARAAQAVQMAQDMGVRIILDGPFPMTSGTPTAGQAAVVTQADAYGKAVAGPGVIYADYAALHDAASFGKWRSEYNLDGLHPTEAGVAGPVLTAQSIALNALGI